MASFNFTDIQKAADEKFSDFIVIAPAEEGVEGSTEELTFKHILREPTEKRKALAAALDLKTYKTDKEFKALDRIEASIHVIKEAMRTVAATPRDFERLEAVVREANSGKDDIGTWEELIAEYVTHTKLGEV